MHLFFEVIVRVCVYKNKPGDLRISLPCFS